MHMNEYDVPDSDENGLSCLPPNDTMQLEEKALMFDKVQEAKTKDKAFTLIICLLIALGVIYITDTVVSALGFTPSTLGATLIDGFKLFISSLIGYVFAEKHRQDK